MDDDEDDPGIPGLEPSRARPLEELLLLLTATSGKPPPPEPPNRNLEIIKTIVQ